MMFAGVDSIVYLIGSLLPIFLVERFGRRKIMLWGLVAQAATLACIGGCQKAFNDYQAGIFPGGAGGGKAAGAFTMLFNFAFGASWLGMAWLYPAEIFSTGLRAKGNSFSTAANWLGNFIVAEIAPVMFDGIGFWTYIFFAFLNVGFIPIVYFSYPETKGLTLEQIEILFATQEIQDDVRSTTGSHIGSSALKHHTRSDVEAASRKHDYPEKEAPPSIQSQPNTA